MKIVNLFVKKVNMKKEQIFYGVLGSFYLEREFVIKRIYKYCFDENNLDCLGHG